MAEVVVNQQNLDQAQTYIDFVKTNLEPLAQQLKVSVNWLWNILVQQARVEAIVYLIICVSMLLTAAFLTRLFFKSFKTATFRNGYSSRYEYKHNKTGGVIPTLSLDWEDRKNYTQVEVINETNRDGVISYISGIGAAVLIVAGIVTSSTSLPIIVTGLINPEYRAIEKIVEFAKPAAKETEVKVEAK
jgi:small-conductance mechanosensitive channel